MSLDLSGTAVFHADATVEIGGGHVRRCIVLAKALLEDGWSVLFASCQGTAEVVPSLRKIGIKLISVNNREDVAARLRADVPNGCDLLVVDSYRLDGAFERACRPWARRILTIDDLADRRHDCDVLVDQAPGRSAADYRSLVPPHCTILAGSNYALLDSSFARARTATACRDGDVRRVFVCFGSTDPAGATVRALAALQHADLGVAIDVVIGGLNPHRQLVQSAANRLSPPATVHVDVEDMASLISRADLAIGAGGVGALERCCLGVPSILVVLAENQRVNASAICCAGAALIVEDSELCDTDAIASNIRSLAHNKSTLASMSVAAAMIVDGLGAMRVRRFCYAASSSERCN